MMPYLKLYTEARNDAKLHSLTDAQHRVWLHLLCFSAEQPERGTIRGLTHHHVAVEVARGDQDLLVTTCNALAALQSVTWCYLEDGTVEIVFVSFEKRQAIKPSADPERVKERVAKHRQQKRSADVTPVTRCNAPVTRCNALDIDGDGDGELIHPPVVPPQSPDRGTGHRDPADLALVNEAIKLLADDGTTEHVGLELGRMHSSSDLLKIPGWKWLRAVRNIQGSGVALGKRRSFAYLLTAAKNLRDDEREEKASTPAVKENATQRARREWKEKNAEVKARRLKERQDADANA